MGSILDILAQKIRMGSVLDVREKMQYNPQRQLHLYGPGRFLEPKQHYNGSRDEDLGLGLADRLRADLP